MFRSMAVFIEGKQFPAKMRNDYVLYKKLIKKIFL